jgi:hypothetical protein
MRVLVASALVFLALTRPATCEEPGAARDTADVAAIQRVVLDNMEGWYEGNGERMKRALHADLAKRIVWTNEKTGREYLDNSTAKELIRATARYGGCLVSDSEVPRPRCAITPREKQQKDITIFDIYGKDASAKAEFYEWVDYLHLAKIDGLWKIVNVLWQFKPKKNAKSEIPNDTVTEN